MSNVLCDLLYTYHESGRPCTLEPITRKGCRFVEGLGLNDMGDIWHDESWPDIQQLARDGGLSIQIHDVPRDHLGLA